MAFVPQRPIRVTFPYQRNVAYSEIATVESIADIRGYTFFQIYQMIKEGLLAAGVSSDKISWESTLYFMREILNDYSANVGEFLRGIEYEGGGGIFKIPSLRDIHYVSVNGYEATRVAESVMTSYRAAESSMSDTQWLYSYIGTLLNVYPAIGESDTIVILASLMADDIAEDAGDTIVPHIDSSALHHGTLWKCLEHQQKQFAHEQMEYIRIRDSRASKVAGQVTPSQIRPFPL